MIRILPRVCVAAAMVAAACVQSPQPTGPEAGRRRLDLLGEALAAANHDRGQAARLFAAAGPGATLERVRLEQWISAVEGSNGGVQEWQRLAEEALPKDLDSRVVVGLARTLATDDRLHDAATVLEHAGPHARVAADLELMELGDGPWREPAARRLAVTAPHRLRRAAPRNEAIAVAALSPGDQIERAVAWRRAGSPRVCATELRSHRFSGDDERRRRLVLAGCEIDAGQPMRAIAAVRGLSATDPERRLIRAEAYRRQGWQRFPRSTAIASFKACLESAGPALGPAAAGTDLERRWLRLILECGTEAGRVDEALAAWWRLEARGWGDAPRDWLGRRLGVAVARRGGDQRSVLQLASAMPNQERCLRFWAALTSSDRDRAIGDLTAARFPDLYGLWARQITGEPAVGGIVLGAPVAPGDPPEIVAWLVEREALALAASEWRRIRARRGSWLADGLAEAALADRRGRQMDAIIALRAAIPDLGTVAMDRVPVNAVRAYLPLRWPDALKSSAAEFGIDPWLLAGVARQESAFTAHARSPRGAMGVMQLLEGTARGHARAFGLRGRPDLGDPELNIRIGARELSRLVKRFGAVEPALAAYNAGETRVRGWWRREPDRYRFTEAVPIPETYTYIRRVSFLAEAYRLVYADEWGRTP